jgi:hypothetical protein
MVGFTALSSDTEQPVQACPLSQITGVRGLAANACSNRVSWTREQPSDAAEAAAYIRKARRVTFIVPRTSVGVGEWESTLRPSRLAG